jgi:hypothetical protein
LKAFIPSLCHQSKWLNYRMSAIGRLSSNTGFRDGL